MNNRNNRVSELFQKYLSNEATEAQRQEFLEYVDDPLYKEQIKQLLSGSFENQTEVDGLNEDGRNRVLNQIFNEENPQSNKTKRYRLWLRLPVRQAGIAAAALILIALSFGLYFYSGPDRTTQYAIRNTKQDIAPGGNKAILTLADGRKISLTDATNGALAEQSGIRITKTGDGQLVYEVRHLEGGRTERSLPAVEMTYNTIETPRGGQYQVILPDGTKVWLNAASSLKYPISFASLKERRVELNGEAYFEVAKDKSHPFVVNTVKQEIEVLGTHFNVNSYADEGLTKTTLLEGSVKVSAPFSTSSLERAGVRLQPGQQSVLTGNGISVSEVNTEEAMAWKNGYFMFESENIKSIMRKIERWYDVEVVYNGEMPTDRFGGTVSRFGNVSQVLKKLELTNRVHFKIEAMPDGRQGRRIMVSR